MTEKALLAADRILSIKIDPTHPDYLKITSLQKETLAAVLSTQARVDETTLRGARSDKRRELIDRIKSEQPGPTG